MRVFLILVSVFDPSKLQTGEFLVFSLRGLIWCLCLKLFNCELELLFFSLSFFPFFPWFDLVFVFELFVMRGGVVPFRA